MLPEGLRMDRALELQALLAQSQACLVRADALKLELVAIFLCQAIDRLKIELEHIVTEEGGEA